MGQARAEKLSRIIITLFGAVGLIWGYAIQQFSQTVYVLGAGFALTAFVSYIYSIIHFFIATLFILYRRTTLYTILSIAIV